MTVQVASSIPTKRLAAAILSTDAAFSLNNILGWDGTSLTSADFSTTGRGVFRNPENTQIELFTFDPTTIGNATITILARGLDYKGGTTDGVKTKYNWPANSTLVELGSNPPAMEEDYVDKLSDESISGIKTFNSSPIVPTPTNPTQAATKAYVDSVAISGAGFADDTTAGLVERATQAEIEAGTTLGGSGASLFINPSRSGARLYYGYAADAGVNDTYVITLAPVPTVYTTGMIIQFKANTANTGACTLNANGLGAKSLKINKDLDPRDNYIRAGSIVTVVYDGTNFQILSVSAQAQVSQDGAEIYAADGGVSDTYAITVAPVPAAYVTGMVFRFKANTVNTGPATLNVNGLGAINILRPDGSALANGDIAASMINEVVYNGASFLLISPVANSPKFAHGTTTRAGNTASSTLTIAHGLGRAPRFVEIVATKGFGTTTNGIVAHSHGQYDGTTTSCVWSLVSEPGTSDGANETTNVLVIKDATGSGTMQVATITTDATNISLVFVLSGTPNVANINILWKAIV